jgi:4-hydroxy-tetrahydrodipicolinate synthase
MRLGGFIVPVLTPFTEDYEVDYDALSKFVEHLLREGVEGVFPLGTNGEFALLSAEEREEVIRVTAETVKHRVPVLAGVSDPGTKNVVRFAKKAEDSGADYIVATPPYYYSVSPEGVFDHYKTVSESVSVPVVMYHIPSNTHTEIPLDWLKRIAELPNLAGMKYTTRDFPSYLEALFELKSEKFSVMMGTDVLIHSTLEAGSDGVVSGLGNVAPGECTEIYNKIREGKSREAWEIQKRIMPAAQAMFIGDFPAAVKEMVSLRGFSVGPVRPPLAELTQQQKATIRAAMVRSRLVDT